MPSLYFSHCPCFSRSSISNTSPSGTSLCHFYFFFLFLSYSSLACIYPFFLILSRIFLFYLYSYFDVIHCILSTSHNSLRNFGNTRFFSFVFCIKVCSLRVFQFGEKCTCDDRIVWTKGLEKTTTV